MKLSIIIPTLNESLYLSDTVLAICEHAVLCEPHEIVVVDCGSTDGTADIAQELGVRLIQDECEGSMAGRAFALNKGAEYASGDVLLFLDADTVLPPGYDVAIHTALKDPETVGGAFEFALDGRGFGLRVVELINRVRYRLSQRYYGDQGIFVRASVFRKLGGYPERRILEAAYLCDLLLRLGNLVLIRDPVKTSPRRFLEGGVYRVLVNDIKIWWLDLIGRSVDQYVNDYWRENKFRGQR